MTEEEILLIKDDADRADAVAAFLESAEPTPSFLNALAKDRYDVIRADALDCAITGAVSLDRDILGALAREEVAPLVRGRLKLYLTLSQMDEEAALIGDRVFADWGKRDEPWVQACEYCARRDGQSFLAMSRLLFEDDYGVAEICLDLMLLLMVGLHRKMLDALLAASTCLPELRISKMRLVEARQLLANETLPSLGIADFKAQLS